MATHGSSIATHRPRRLTQSHYPRRVRVLTDEEYDNYRDCCCHKLGRLRPHSPAQCRDIA